MKTNDCTILVLSSDNYADLWKPFFMLFQKYWPDCPYPVALGSNTVPYKSVHTILSGPDHNWSSSLIQILTQIKTRYVFVWLEDIFPVSRINTSEFDRALAFMQKRKARHMHISPALKPDISLEGGTFGEIARGAPYRATAFGFWDIAYLSKLLLPGESPWQFEIMGSYRTAYTDGFYCMMHPLFDRIHVVEKGKIFSDAYEYCKNHKIPLDSSRRSILSGAVSVRSVLQALYFNIVIHIPWQKRLAAMNILRKLFISY